MGDSQVTHHGKLTFATAADASSQVTEDFSLFADAGIPGSQTLYSSVVTATAIGTAAKTTTAAVPAVGSLVPVRFTNGNSAASPTLDFATGDPVSLLLGGTAPGADEVTVGANGVVMCWYDGVALHMFGAVS